MHDTPRNMIGKTYLRRNSNTLYSNIGGDISMNYDTYLEWLCEKLQLAMVQEENNKVKDIETFGEVLGMELIYKYETTLS